MKRLILMLTVLASLIMAPVAALAYSPLGAACNQAGTANVAACNAPVETVGGQGGVLTRVAKFISALAGIAAIIMIVVSAFFFVTAGGDPSKISSARATLVGAIIGLVIVAAAQSILNFVLNKV